MPSAKAETVHGYEPIHNKAMINCGSTPISFGSCYKDQSTLQEHNVVEASQLALVLVRACEMILLFPVRTHKST